ncbi:MAG TPA: hypothetical protein VK826_02775, partial [Bacteroidia bacterium]|nr:hypothetical protein [Bacteroidia bacterium]
KMFNCAANNLSRLDVSANTNLFQLDCDENPKLDKICVNTEQRQQLENGKMNWRRDQGVVWTVDCAGE